MEQLLCVRQRSCSFFVRNVIKMTIEKCAIYTKKRMHNCKNVQNHGERGIFCPNSIDKELRWNYYITTI